MRLSDFVDSHSEKVLDVGCNVGDFLSDAENRGAQKLFGVDINERAIELAKERFENQPHYHFHHGSADQIPFESNSMDLITCSEVIEHIPEELRKKTIQEFKRLLKPTGRLIITVPHAGLFAALDPSNMRFRFPGLYQKVSEMIPGYSRDKGYEGEKHGVVWHHHFRVSELEALFAPEFETKEVRTMGAFLTPLGEWVLFPLYRLNRLNNPFYRSVKALQKLEKDLNVPRWLGYNVLMVFNPSRIGSSSS